jgi:uncharacterized protein (TIGR00304 family)
MLGYSQLGFVLVIGGIITLLVATTVSSRGRSKSSEVKAAGVVMIGPIPIIFGTDTRWLIVAIVLAIVLVALELFVSFR